MLPAAATYRAVAWRLGLAGAATALVNYVNAAVLFESGSVLDAHAVGVVLVAAVGDFARAHRTLFAATYVSNRWIAMPIPPLVVLLAHSATDSIRPAFVNVALSFHYIPDYLDTKNAESVRLENPRIC